MKKLSILFVTLFMFILACEKNDEVIPQQNETEQGDQPDTIPPQNVSNLAIVPLNKSVNITWTNPSDFDFAGTTIEYGSEIIEVDPLDTQLLIEGLTNETEYTFIISTFDDSNNASDTIHIKAIPDEYVTKLEGSQVSSGEYVRVNSQFSITTTINNNDYKSVMLAGPSEFIWEGTWSVDDDTTYRYDVEYYVIDPEPVGRHHVADIVKRKNNAFNYTYSDSVMYIENAYEKVDGNNNYLPGEYKYYMMDISSDASSYSDTTYYYATISADGNITYRDSDDNTDASTWVNDDMLNGRFLFVTYNSRTYLVIRDKSIRYLKQ